MPDDTLINLFGLPREQFESLCAEVDGKPYRAHQMMKWAYHERVLDFMAMTNLSKKFRSWLCDHAEFKVPEIVRRLDSADGTIKWVIKVSADAKASKSADVKASKSADVKLAEWSVVPSPSLTSAPPSTAARTGNPISRITRCVL